MSGPNNLTPVNSIFEHRRETASLLLNAYALLRPTTAVVMRMLNKLNVTRSSSTGSGKKIKASDIQKLIDKFCRRQRKSHDSHKALLLALEDWLADIPSHSTSEMAMELVTLMEEISSLHASHSELLNGLKVQLGSVATREVRQHTLLRKHDQLQRSHEAVDMKHGPQSKQAAMVVDEIEENEYNLKLIEQQLARSANTGLTEVSLEYLKWFQSAFYNLRKKSKNLANILRENEAAMIGSARTFGIDSGKAFDDHFSSAKLSLATLLEPELQRIGAVAAAVGGTALYGGKRSDSDGTSMLKHGGNRNIHTEPKREVYESRHDSHFAETSMRQAAWPENEMEGLFKGMEGW